MLLLAQAAPAPAAPSSEDEIVVVARKMQLIEIDVKTPRRDGKLVLQRCSVRNPTGHAEIDVIPCQVAQECIADAPAARKQLERCIEERSQLRLDAVVAAWRARS